MQLIRSIIRVALSPPIVLMVSKVYIPVLFPLTFLIGLTSMLLDRALDGALSPFGLHTAAGFLPTPTNFAVAVASFVLGAALWLWTYEVLVREGKGSPSPTAGRTQRLVRTGIYAYSRNPSIFGKLFGVMAVGFALNSFSFCFILVPLLLTGSLVEKVWRQEPQLVEVFGDEYLEYQRDVPLFFPWKLFVPKR